MAWPFSHSVKPTFPIGSLSFWIGAKLKLKTRLVKKVLQALAVLGTKELKSSGVGKFVVPGLVMIKMHKKPATEACKRMVFGNEVVVKARPARTIVKASPAPIIRVIVQSPGMADWLLQRTISKSSNAAYVATGL